MTGPIGVATRSLGKPNPVLHRLRKSSFGWHTVCNGGRAEPVDPTQIVGRRCTKCAARDGHGNG